MWWERTADSPSKTESLISKVLSVGESTAVGTPAKVHSTHRWENNNSADAVAEVERILD